MRHAILNACPVCQGTLAVTAMECAGCGTAIRGSFDLGALARLAPSQAQFVVSFLAARGNIREMEKIYQISYPTVRSRIDEILAALGEPPSKNIDQDVDSDQCSAQAPHAAAAKSPQQQGRPASATPSAGQPHATAFATMAEDCRANAANKAIAANDGPMNALHMSGSPTSGSPAKTPPAKPVPANSARSEDAANDGVKPGASSSAASGAAAMNATGENAPGKATIARESSVAAAPPMQKPLSKRAVLELLSQGKIDTATAQRMIKGL